MPDHRELRFRRDESVSAVQHGRDIQATFDGLREIGGMQCAGFVGLESGAIEVRYLDRMEVAEPGDWIVISAMRGVHVCAEGDFRATYEPVGQGEVVCYRAGDEFDHDGEVRPCEQCGANVCEVCVEHLGGDEWLCSGCACEQAGLGQGELPEGLGEGWTIWVKGDEWHVPSGHLGVARDATPQEAEGLRAKGWTPIVVIPQSGVGQGERAYTREELLGKEAKEGAASAIFRFHDAAEADPAWSRLRGWLKDEYRGRANSALLGALDAIDKGKGGEDG